MSTRSGIQSLKVCSFTSRRLQSRQSTAHTTHYVVRTKRHLLHGFGIHQQFHVAYGRQRPMHLKALSEHAEKVSTAALPSASSLPPSSKISPPCLTCAELGAISELHLENIYALGIISSPEELAHQLGSDLERGLPANDDLDYRSSLYGSNKLPEAPETSFLELIIEAFKDFTIAALSIAGVASLALEYTVNGGQEGGANWLDGASILFAVALVVGVSAVSNWQKEKQFRNLQKIQRNGQVRAIRAGQEVVLYNTDVLTGDLLLLEAGDILCADGILTEGTDIKVDESHLTGESGDIAKDPEISHCMYSGSKVVTGFGKMLVTSVGRRCQAGMVMDMLAGAEEGLMEETVLQKKLNGYATEIGKVGLAAGVVSFVGMTARFTLSTFVWGGETWDWAYLGKYLDFFITGVTILVVAIPEGLPLAVTVALAYSVQKMLSDNNLVRHLGAAETMGTATVLCSDKTGTLTQNDMAVTNIWVGGKLLHNLSEASLSSALHPDILDLICEGIVINSTANVFYDSEGTLQQSGNRTETALIRLALGLGADVSLIRKGANISSQVPFSSERKMMTTVVMGEGEGVQADIFDTVQSTDSTTNGSGGRNNNTSSSSTASASVDKTISGEDQIRARIYTKGAAEIVLDLCHWQLLPDGSKTPLGDSEKATLLENFSRAGLRMLCLAYRDTSIGIAMANAAMEKPESGLTLIGLLSLEDPLRPEVPAAVLSLQKAGITVKMLTGDNANTAVAIAKQCNILPSNTSIVEDLTNKPYSVMEGADFRKKVLKNADTGEINEEAFLEIWPQLRVMARCSPTDKHTIVRGCRGLTQDIIGVTGDGTNDAPALRAANVGFAMNAGTDIAKEAADIILIDNNFASTVSAVLWGRNVFYSISKFLQFQLTVSVVAVILAMAGALWSTESPLTAVQMLWVNLIMDSLASLALATEAPDPSLLNLPPYTQDYDFFDPKTPVFKNIIGQATYQLIILTAMLAYVPTWLDVPNHLDISGPSIHYTMVFNSFVMMQLFNQINARKLLDASSVWEGLSGAQLFLIVLLGEAVLQVGIVQFGGEVFDTQALDVKQWAICVGLGAGSLVVREILRRVNLSPSLES